MTKAHMPRRVGFALMTSALLLAVIFQWQGKLFTQPEPPKVASQIEYTKEDGTIVRNTSVRSKAGGLQWISVAPIGILFFAGAALVSFSKH